MASNDIDKFITQLKKFSRWINDKQVNIRLARKCREIVYRRVKSGKGVDSDSKDPESTNLVALKPLSKSYKDYRNGLAIFRTMPSGKVVRFGAVAKTYKFTNFETGKVTTRKNKNPTNFTKPTLGEFGKPDKSNLTLTGQMLDNIVMTSTETGFALIIKNNSRRDGKLTNRQVSDYVSNGGSFKNGNGKTVKIPARPFMALTSGEIRIITRELETIIKEIIQKNVR